MKRVLSVLISALLLGTFTPAAMADDPTITVMSRNLYLGADVGVAMELLPDFPAATQFMWDQMSETDFPTRSKEFVKEIAFSDPDVIGLQEATNWYCQKNLIGKDVVIYDFVEILLADLKSAGLEYEVANKDGNVAQNVGFEIKPIAYLTKATDSEIFEPVFDQEFAYCGFEIADVLLIKSSLSEDLLAVGTSEYEAKYTIIPTLMTVYRGYSWADINFGGKPVRFVTTHLESLFDETKVPVAKLQADQLVTDLSTTKIPVVVMGDFNSDPRDPRGAGQHNPGGQPIENELCKAQKDLTNMLQADSTCNAYWTMVEAGFVNVSPESMKPSNFTWGLNASLSGPDEIRGPAAKEMGNEFGFTDRLDYIFANGEIELVSTELIGNNQTGTQNTKVWASDHAGLVSTIQIRSSAEYLEEPLSDHSRFPIGFWKAAGILLSLIALLLGVLGFRIRRRAGNLAN
jgi:endonuclease/exonuclease/phosphatase family metal-dependent hydrolase